MGTSFDDGFIMRLKNVYECHDHVQNHRVLSKIRCHHTEGSSPSRWTFTKTKGQCILRDRREHQWPRVVRFFYSWNSEYIRDKLYCNNDTYTSNVSNKQGYRGIGDVYVGVNSCINIPGQVTSHSHRNPHPQDLNILGTIVCKLRRVFIILQE